MPDQNPNANQPDAASKLEVKVGSAIEVSAGLVFRHGLLLITQRRPDGHLGGMWEFPGGKRHPDETDEDCLKRELMEELGIEVEIKAIFDTVTHAYPEQTVSIKFFHCNWQKNEPRAVDCHDFAWVGRDQLANYTFPPADAQLLNKLRDAQAVWA